ncbi:cation:proton antiporter [Candidatus Bathyarchaeota archaeon]|nr:cation:proton antiporter [Candidatus Bathyarchaeota archaeon]MBS7617304.1 cation:proton antiporter [Candidatus Bathyarchaeota archaeon]
MSLTYRMNAILDPALRAILSLCVLIVIAKITAEIFTPLKVPVLGELLAGMVFGPYALGAAITIYGVPLVEFNDIVFAFAEIGGIVLLFLAGLETSFAELKEVLWPSILTSCVGVVLTFLLGYLLSVSFGLSPQSAIILAASISVTGAAVTVRILEDLHLASTKESQVVINAVMVDSIFGVILLALARSVALNSTFPSVSNILETALKVILLLVVILAVGAYAIPYVIDQSEWRVAGSVESLSIASCFFLAALSQAIGLSSYVGALIAGMAVARAKSIKRVREFTSTIALIFSPMFFGVMGAAANLTSFNPLSAGLLAALTFIAIIGKLVGCTLPVLLLSRKNLKALNVGISMISRGEISIIIASIGLTFGIITSDLYSTIVLMTLILAFTSSILLHKSYSTTSKQSQLTQGAQK